MHIQCKDSFRGCVLGRVPSALILLMLFLLILACSFPLAPLEHVSCGDHFLVRHILGQTSQAQWVDWIARFSGEQPVEIGGETMTIDTRFSHAMFAGQRNARAFDYLYEQVSRWVAAEQIEVDPYIYTDENGRSYEWKNLIVTLPGAIRPEEVIVLSAHLDSTTVREGNPFEYAPGADDNGSGVATLMEAVRIYRAYYFARTIRVIWFTGEEQGAVGSHAYLSDHPMENVLGVINLDMFAYDHNGDRCLELHVGKLAASDVLGRCFVDMAEVYGYDFRYDYLIDQATDRSDHAAFWKKDVGAILVLENLIEQNIPGGCGIADGNPYYHKPGDTLTNLDVAYGFDIARTALATAAQLAQPLMPKPLP
ncbi:MAG: Zn-dependent exopeptidase M28 [Anaerolineae bacterium]|nr:Zn-dependent exopeptidase M28 [Anaerolineae bacterium]